MTTNQTQVAHVPFQDKALAIFKAAKTPVSTFFAETLKAPLRNPLWSWGASVNNLVILKEDRALVAPGGRIEVGFPDDPAKEHQNPGLIERRKHLATLEGEFFMLLIRRGKGGSVLGYSSDALYPLAIDPTADDKGVTWATLGAPVDPVTRLPLPLGEESPSEKSKVTTLEAPTSADPTPPATTPPAKPAKARKTV